MTTTPSLSHSMTSPSTIALSVIVEELVPQARTLLEIQGCKVMHVGDGRSMIIYPPHSMRRMIATYGNHAHYRVYFKNGFQLQEVHSVGNNIRAIYVDKWYRGFMEEK